MIARRVRGGGLAGALMLAGVAAFAAPSAHAAASSAEVTQSGGPEADRLG